MVEPQHNGLMPLGMRRTPMSGLKHCHECPHSLRDMSHSADWMLAVLSHTRQADFCVGGVKRHTEVCVCRHRTGTQQFTYTIEVIVC